MEITAITTDTNLETALRKQLQQMVDLRRTGVWPKPPDGVRFLCVEDMVLQHGRIYKAAPTNWHPIPRACFHLAYERAVRPRKSEWIYVEGYAARPTLGIVVQHAWLTRADTPQLAYDTAWDDNAEAIYLGIPVQAAYVRKCHRSSKHGYYSAFDTWWLGHPLLTGKVRIEDIQC
jgi:hypothetical protein